MNKNQIWIDALESGDYKQTRACLSQRDDDDVMRHCCLGVLADVMDAPRYRDYDNKLFVEWSNYIHVDDVPRDNNTVGLSSSMLDEDWFADTTGLDADTQSNLAYCNDNGATFAEIAQALQSDDPRAAIAQMAIEQQFAAPPYTTKENQ